MDFRSDRTVDGHAAVLARDLAADLLVIVTDASGVALDWGTTRERVIRSASPADLAGLEFAAGSMGPKVAAAISFAKSNPDGAALIGALSDLSAILRGEAGTRISQSAPTLTTYS